MSLFTTRTAFVAAVLAALMLVLSACGPGAKSRELSDLERILQDPAAKEVKSAPGASKPYREARQFRNLSREAWEEGKEDLSREYAILGTLSYRTAAAIKEQVEQKERLDAANAKIVTTNPELEALDQELAKLMTEVSTLERQAATAKRANEAMAQREALRGNTQTASAKRLAINNRLNDVEAARKQADLVEAQTHAAGKYNRASNTLKSVRTLLDAGQANDQMMEQANTALRLFQEAKTEAQAGYQEAVAKSNPEDRRKSLRNDASKVFGGEQVVTERRGARIVLPALFSQGSAEIDSGMNAQVQEIIRLANKYDEFSLFVEGYTSTRGSATDSLGTAQLRASAVRKALTAGGISSNRIETRGFGQERPRYSVDARNERVEIVMTRPD